MKKIIPLVLFVLIIAFVAFFFLNNGMAMTTLISQDHAIIAKTYNKGLKRVTEHESFEFETVTKSYKDGKVTTDKKIKVKLVRKGDVVKKLFATVHTDVEDIEVYYVAGDTVNKTYVTRTPAGDTPTIEYFVYEDATVDDILDTIVEAKPVLFALDGVDTMTTMDALTKYKKQDEKQFKDKVSSTFTFSPLGAQYEYKVSDTESYFAKIDILGTLHNITYKNGTAKEYTTTVTEFTGYDNKVSIYWKNEQNFREVAVTNFHTGA